MRRLRVQLTVLLALLGMLVLAWGAAIFLGARDAARSSGGPPPGSAASSWPWR
jgi:hypothetical protein